MLGGRFFKGLCVFVGSGFGHFPCLNATGTDHHALYGTIWEADFDLLQIGEETPARNSGGFKADSAGFLRQTAPGNGATDNRFLITNNAVSHKGLIIRVSSFLARNFF